MWALTLTILVVANNQVVPQTYTIERFASQETCMQIVPIAVANIRETARRSGTVPGIVNCSKEA
jgi:hypothetical protein